MRAHLHALLRRCPRPSALELQDRFLVTEHLALHIGRQCLVGPSGERTLTQQEYRLLRYLVQCDGAVVSRDELLDAAWEPGAVGSPREVDVYVRYLRRKLEPDPRRPRYLLTVWGQGYRYVLPERETSEHDGREVNTSA